MKRALAIAGVAVGACLALLGALWTAQGLGWIRLEPIACVGECNALTGPNTTWTVVGMLTLLLGATTIAVLTRSLRHAGNGQP